MTIGVWFRNDLRVRDNPALHAACKGTVPVVAIYLFTPAQHEQHGVGLNKQRFIIENLLALREELAALGIPLIARKCRHFKDSITTLLSICREHSISALHCNEEYEINEQARDTTALSQLKKKGIPLNRHQDQVLLAPGAVMTAQGSAFRVFTPFKRAWLKQIAGEDITPLPSPKRRRPAPADATPAAEIERWIWPQPANRFWQAGSQEAYRRLTAFTESRVQTYGNVRDYPAIAGTSQLSPYLAVGAISARTCMFSALSSNRFDWAAGNPGILAWINELIWREFYKHLIFHFPDLCKGHSFQPATHAVRWERNQDRFDAWREGRTGFPLVDAAMRQLNATGWMHNRLRMVTAMFLSKHLFIDWRLGEAWFMDQLIDADFAANNGGWQWSASTGADAAPYFRVFNPTRQSQRFDPQGEFISHWVPELNSLTTPQIHDPDPLERRLCHYPDPIVDHRTAVERVKSEFQAVKAMETA